jgi:hypothetical protein
MPYRRAPPKTVRDRRALRWSLPPLVAAACALAIGPLAAGAAAALDLQGDLQRRWQGAWVILDAVSHSSCDSLYTNNQVVSGAAGSELVSRGTFELPAGELARVAKIDLKRRRVDLLLDLWEPLLVEYSDGPFELARQVTCRVELLLPLERETVKGGRVEPIESALSPLVLRFTDEQSARASEAWNARAVEPLPEGYEQTWAEYERWKYSEAIAAAGTEIENLTGRGRYRSEPEYALGYTAGLRHHHTLPDDCLALAEASAPYHTGSPPSHLDKGQKRDWKDGYLDGSRVAYHTAALTRLSACLAAVR